MLRRLANLTLDNFEDLPRRCRRCVYWELDPISRDRAERVGDPALEKEAWLSATLLDWGSCGQIAYVDNAPAGFACYAPPRYLPRGFAFPTSPVSADAVLLTTVYVAPTFGSTGVGRALVQAAARDLLRRGIKAVEAFGEDIHAMAPRSAVDTACVVPGDFLRAVGFKTVRAHQRYPRLRLNLETALSPAQSVEYAIAELFEAVDATLSGSIRT
jgi:GNAT superfamily N-acetyltransferase